MPTRYYQDSDSCRRHLDGRSPRFTHTPFLDVPPPTTWTAWPSLYQPNQRDHCVSDFAITLQARRRSPPNRVRHPTDRQFAFRCSPPRIAATQLRSATGPWHSPARTSTVLCVCARERTGRPFSGAAWIAVLWQNHRKAAPQEQLSSSSRSGVPPFGAVANHGVGSPLSGGWGDGRLRRLAAD
jgi:hypothetical protein